jgi:hypothetical protein
MFISLFVMQWRGLASSFKNQRNPSMPRSKGQRRTAGANAANKRKREESLVPDGAVAAIVLDQAVLDAGPPKKV